MDKAASPRLARPGAIVSPPLDYNTWTPKEYWSISEASKLLCGRNPYEKIPGPQLFNRDRRTIDIVDLAFAAAQAGEMKVVRSALLPIHVLVDPGSFLRWAEAQGLTIPPPLTRLAEQLEPIDRDLAGALLRERVTTIARTLWILDPSLSSAQVAYHQAMQDLVSETEVKMAERLDWIESAKPH